MVYGLVLQLPHGLCLTCALYEKAYYCPTCIKQSVRGSSKSYHRGRVTAKIRLLLNWGGYIGWCNWIYLPVIGFYFIAIIKNLNMSFVLKLKLHPIKMSYPINTEFWLDNLEYKHETCAQKFFIRETWTPACSTTILDYLCTAENVTGTCYNQWEGNITA